MSDDDFHDVRLPKWFEKLASSSCDFSTSVTKLSSGREVRNSDFPEAVYEYCFAGAILTQEQFRIIHNFFLARMGKRFSFRFRDTKDSEMIRQYIATTDGERTNFPVFRIYYDPLHPGKRSSLKISREEQTKVYLDDVKTEAVIDHENAMIKFNEAPAAGKVITIDAIFDIQVRFNCDKYKCKTREDGAMEILELSLIEVKT